LPDLESIPQRGARAFFTLWTVVWIVAWVALFVVMHVSLPEGTSVPPGGDKVMHFIAYFALALLGARSAFSRKLELTPRWLIKWLIIYAVYGAADEWLQGLVNRTPSVTDWAADVAGAWAALGMAYVNRPVESEPDSP